MIERRNVPPRLQQRYVVSWPAVPGAPANCDIFDTITV